MRARRRAKPALDAVKAEDRGRRQDRQRARSTILAEANRFRNRPEAPTGRSPLTMRHIERAVCIVRRNRLVADKVLVAAGFTGAS